MANDGREELDASGMPDRLDRLYTETGTIYSDGSVTSCIFDIDNIDTPTDSPYSSAIGVVTSDMGHMEMSPELRFPEGVDSTDCFCSTVCNCCPDQVERLEGLETPRPPQQHLPDLSEPAEPPTPVKTRSLFRVVGKAKVLVKALVQRKMRKDKDAATPMPASASTFAMSTAIPGSWQQTLSRPSMSVLIKAEIQADREKAKARMVSLTSTTGIYNPGPDSPAIIYDFPAEFAAQESDSESGESMGFSLLHGHKPEERSPLFTIFLIVQFVPWCIAVGAAILLLPQSLDTVVFRSGYIPAPPPRGLRRYAFWSKMAPDYVKIFMFTLLGLFNVSVRGAATLVVLVAMRCAYVWKDYKPKEVKDLHMRIGQDDMESLWLFVQNETYIDEVLQACPPEQAVMEVAEVGTAMPEQWVN
ncbi:hypothetical protein C8Q74DRAFT_1366749 [Fomes fomentarius]|nr:hypothetical protein C8Q74DRAFT_1366749 [Fomes fomentarius]